MMPDDPPGINGRPMCAHHHRLRAERLEALRLRALARNARRRRAWCALADSAVISTWTGRMSGRTIQRLALARRLAIESQMTYVRIALAAHGAGLPRSRR